jgi:hypothetical protein
LGGGAEVSLLDPDVLTRPVNRGISNPPAIDPDILTQPVNPDVLTPSEPDPCEEAEAALNGFLPQTETLKKTDSSWTNRNVTCTLSRS